MYVWRECARANSLYMSSWLSWLVVFFKAFLLIFCLLLSVIQKGHQNLVMIMDLSISICSSSRFCFKYFQALILCINVYYYYALLKSLLHHYEIIFFILGNIIFCEIYFVWYYNVWFFLLFLLIYIFIVNVFYLSSMYFSLAF